MANFFKNIGNLVKAASNPWDNNTVAGAIGNFFQKPGTNAYFDTSYVTPTGQKGSTVSDYFKNTPAPAGAVMQNRSMNTGQVIPALGPANGNRYATGTGQWIDKPVLVGPAPTLPPVPPSDPFTMDSTGGTAGGGGGTGAAAAPLVDTTPQYVYLGDKPYNLTDPTERDAFYNDRKSTLLGQLNDAIALYKSQYDQAVTDAQSADAKQLGTIKMNLANLDTQYKAYLKSVDDTLGGLDEAYRSGNAQRMATFAALSPNAYQSSQATSEQYATDKYNKAVTDVNAAKDQTGASFGQQQGLYNADINDLGSAFENYQKGAAQTRDQNIRSAQDNVDSQLASTATSLAPIDVAQGNYNPFKYDTSPVKNLVTVNPDVSAYTPAVSFGALQGDPRTNLFANPQGGKYIAPTGTPMNTLASYLGLTPPAKTQSVPLNMFLGY